MAKILMKGAEAIAEAAIQAGCDAFFGYPITPQNEVPEYFAKMMPKLGRTFVQAESEVAAINMVYGAASTGARVMTSSSSPGISLKQEGISYIAGSRLPCVIVNIMRGGPGLGGIQPSQSDYFQATKGGGHGDYHLVVLAPATLQEMADLTQMSFDIAEQYRVPVMILGDGTLGQMMEPVEFGNYTPRAKADVTSWAATGYKNGKERAVINSLYMQPEDLENFNQLLFDTYDEIAKNETMYEEYNTEGAEILLCAYGTVARIAKSAIAQINRMEGMPKIGLIRPITLFPFPTEAIVNAVEKNPVKKVITLEMSMGQMVEDVRLAVNGRCPVEFFGRTGGVIPSVKEVAEAILERIGGGVQ